jgi:hypothetical protein
MEMKKILATIILCTSIKISYAQFNWNTINDTVTLNPATYTVNGSATIKNMGQIISVDNRIIIDFKNKQIFINNFNNLFKFGFFDISNLYLSDAQKVYSEDIISDTEFRDNVIKSYRKKLFNELELNVATFTYSKKNKIDITKEGKLYIKNEKQISGKICAIGIDFVLVLTEDGELLNMEDGDFNSLYCGGTYAKDCKNLYNLIFSFFKKELEQKVNYWEKEVSEKKLNELISTYGAINSIKQINNELTQFEWNWPQITYKVNIRSNSRQISLADYNKSTTFLGFATSKLFLYNNTYRESNSSSDITGVTTTSTNISQTGTVVQSDEGSSIILIKDKSDNTKLLKHKNIFSELDYGKQFKFVNY